VLVLDGKPVILIPAFDRVENLALHRVGGVRSVLGLALVFDRRVGKSLLKEARVEDRFGGRDRPGIEPTGSIANAPFLKPLTAKISCLMAAPVVTVIG
jgi:hypothetical protein